jgi:hypothetical protein
MPWEKKRVFIVVKTYPNPAKTGTEVSCTAAITKEGSWIRLFPVPFRFLDEDKQFPRYSWIDVAVERASDFRPESYKLNPDSIQIVSNVSTKNEWRERKRLIFPLMRHCLCCIKREQEAGGNSAPTLGFFKPANIRRFYMTPCAPDWTQEERMILSQQSLGFSKTPDRILEKVPFDFHYEFKCPHDDCKGHAPKCSDWEIFQAYRKWRPKYGEAEWRAKFEQRFSDEMIHKFDTHFYVGTLKAHPKEWTIVGLFWPPPVAQAGLFGAR